MDFPCGSTGKESTCNEGNLGSIPGLGRFPKKETTTHSSILAWRIPWTTVLGVAKSQTQLSDFHFHFTLRINGELKKIRPMHVLPVFLILKILHFFKHTERSEGFGGLLTGVYRDRDG